MIANKTKRRQKDKKENDKKMIFIVKVTSNKEEQAAELVEMNAKKKSIRILSVLSPRNLRGYIILETDTKENAEMATYRVPYVKGILAKTIGWNEVQNMLKLPSEVMKIEEGDIVEITGDAFKNEKGVVKRINKQKNEVVIELLQAAVPMSVFVKLDNLRVIKKASEREGKEEKE